jgi:hypothetical protein
MTDNKDSRVRTPQEQRANFIGNMGGLMNIGPQERELVAQITDLLGNISDMTKPSLLARIVSNAVREWGDVSSADPSHAKDLALEIGKVARRQPNAIRQVIKETSLSDPELERRTQSARLQADYEVERRARNLIVPQVETNEAAPQPKPRAVMRPPARHP